MLITHCADIHLGSKLSSAFPKNVAEERKTDLRSAVKKMVETSRANGVKIILISGDLFDKDPPVRKDKDFFYSLVEDNSDIDFIYLRGNHDSTEYYSNELPNLKTFDHAWKSYEYDDCGRRIVISGVEIDENNYSSIYDNMNFDKEDFNIVLLHGMDSDSESINDINLKKCAKKNIDYLALGHIHMLKTGKLDDRCNFAYSGCLFGRGFDETGDKGFLIFDTNCNDKNIFFEENCSFYKSSEKIISEIDIDISGASDIYQLRKTVSDKVEKNTDTILRLNTIGARFFDSDEIENEVRNELLPYFRYVSVKDKTYRDYDMSEFADSKSFAGEFVRNVLKNDEISEEDKKTVISYGIRALRGEKTDL